MKRQISGLGSASLLALMLAVGSTGAMAQTAAPAGGAPAAETGIGEVVVTARKSTEKLQTTPVAVTALSTKALVAGHISSLSDLQYSVPGLVKSRRDDGNLAHGTAARSGTATRSRAETRIQRLAPSEI